MKIALYVVVFIIVGFGAYVRLAPSDPARWNIDPVKVADPGKAGVYLAPGTVTFDAAPEVLMARLDGLMRAWPRTKVLAGVPADLQATYVVRSKLFGFPDYVTFRVLPTDTGGSTLTALSRLRFGVGDVGVNRARLDRILAALRQNLQ